MTAAARAPLASGLESFAARLVAHDIDPAALERAFRDGIQATRLDHWYWEVTSSLPAEGGPYQVTLAPTHRACTCLAGQHRTPCKHVALCQLRALTEPEPLPRALQRRGAPSRPTLPTPTPLRPRRAPDDVKGPLHEDAPCSPTPLAALRGVRRADRRARLAPRPRLDSRLPALRTHAGGGPRHRQARPAEAAMMDQTRALAPASPADVTLPGPQQWQILVQQADVFVKSGFLPKKIQKAEQALAIILTGRELGIGSMYALRSIDIIEGIPTPSPGLLLALIYRDHGDTALIPDEITDQVATCRYKRRGWSGYQEFSFTIQDAERAGLLSKQNWRQYPGAMLRARAISAIARLAFPECAAGLYIPDELGAETDREGRSLGVIAERREPIRQESREEAAERGAQLAAWGDEPEEADGEYSVAEGPAASPTDAITEGQLRSIGAHLKRTAITEAAALLQVDGTKQVTQLTREQASELLRWLTRQPNDPDSAS